MSIAGPSSTGVGCAISASVTRLRAPKRRTRALPGGCVFGRQRVSRPAGARGQRLDVFVQSQLRRTSRTRTQAIIVNSAFDARAFARAKRPCSRQAARPAYGARHGTSRPSPPTSASCSRTTTSSRSTSLPFCPSTRRPVTTEHAHPAALRRSSRNVPLARSPPGPRDEWRSARRQDARMRKSAEAPARERNGVRKTYIAITWGVPAGDTSPRFRYERSLELDTDSWLRVKIASARLPRRSTLRRRSSRRPRRGEWQNLCARPLRPRDGSQHRSACTWRRSAPRSSATSSTAPTSDSSCAEPTTSSPPTSPSSSSRPCPTRRGDRAAAPRHGGAAADRLPLRRTRSVLAERFGDLRDPPRPLRLCGSHPSRDLIEVDLIERRPNQRAAVRLGDAARLERLASASIRARSRLYIEMQMTL